MAAPDRPGRPRPEGGGPAVDVATLFRQAIKTATRASLLGALGFGIALLMLVIISERGPTPSPTRFSIEHMLMFGGVLGGLFFTAIALRASRTAKACQERMTRRDR